MGTSVLLFLSARRGVARTTARTLSKFLTQFTPFIWDPLFRGIVKLAERCTDLNLVLFAFLFVLRYYRFFINLYGFWKYRPSPAPKSPTLGPGDVTLIICTVSVSKSQNPDLEECLTTWLVTKPKRIIIVTDTEARAEAAKERYFEICKRIHDGSSLFLDGIGSIDVSLVEASFKYTGLADKRSQMAMAIGMVDTKIMVLLDENVRTPRQFLQAATAVFEDPQVALCGTKKQVRRKSFAPVSSLIQPLIRALQHPDDMRAIVQAGWKLFQTLLVRYWSMYWNFLGIAYLMRHNYELRATAGMDGGVFVISGRAMAVRTVVVNNAEFLDSLTNEKIPLPRLLHLLRLLGIRCDGRVKIGEDNFITQWVLNKGHKVKFQNTDEATVETTLGEPATFISKCLRWRRTTYYYNSRFLLTSTMVWRRWPWTVSLAYIPALSNLALVWDPAMVYMLSRTDGCSRRALLCFCVWIYFTKAVKLFPHFRSYPWDFLLFFFPIPASPLFGYAHTFISISACTSFWNQKWEGRTFERDRED